MNKKLALLFILISPFLFAKKLMLATCEMGSGCTFQLSDIDASDYDIVQGTENGYYENLPENAIVVDAKINGNWENYVETEMTRSQLDKFYGGDGFTMIYPFNPNFQPEDGEWKIQFGTVNGDICYGQQSNLFKKMLEGRMQSGTINFPKPFYARFLMNSPDVKWVKLQPNKYRGTLDFGFGKGPMKLVFDVELINPKEIKGMFTVTIKVPTKEDCINKIPVTFICVKPNEWEDPVDWEEIENQDPNVPRLEDEPKPNVPRLEDDPKPNVPRLNDADDELLDPKSTYQDDPGNNNPDIEIIEDAPKPNVPRIDD